jgi:dipeptidyl aminopeptidase/acylaminoacyl peptidase
MPGAQHRAMSRSIRMGLCMRRVGWTLFLFVTCLCTSGARAEVSPEVFFKHADYSSLKLSPSGKYIGALVPVNGRVELGIVDLATKSAKAIAAVEGQDVAGFDWVNDNRLVFSLIDLQSGLGEQRGGGLFAIDRDGSNFLELAPTVSKAIDSMSWYRPVWPLAMLDDGSDDILVESYSLNQRYTDVYRVDTRSGRRTLKSFNKPGNVVDWVADRQGVVRACVTFDSGNGESRVWWRPSEDAAWVQLGVHALRGPRMIPVAFDGDGSLVVASDVGRETAALYRYDTAKRAVGELVAAHPRIDLTEGLVYDREKHRIVGLRYDAERPGYAWFDDQWAMISKGVDTALPDRMNVLSRGGNRVLVYSYSDADPGTYYLLDLSTRKLEPIVRVRSAVKPSEMPHREPIRYSARDGLSIPAYLTLPRNVDAKKLPLVVEVHGGPWVRGNRWEWEAQAAYLASLGYAVLQPEFRGSAGWGRKAFEASWKQWGRAMQDDLDDGVDDLAKRGIIDAGRVCIMGASYGGYAVMMGLARDPARWKCGVNWVGVTEITYMFDITWSDTWDSDWMKFNAKEMIGDPDKDAALLEAASPLRNASRIKSPVLMAYGGQDRRVPPIHGERMRDALRKNGVPVEWALYEDEGHGFMVEAARYDFYRRVAKFLDAQIGSGATTAGATTATGTTADRTAPAR